MPKAPRRYQERIRNFDPTLRVTWNRRRGCFQVQRQAKTFTRGQGWIRVLDIGPRLRAGGPTDLGSGDRVLSELRRRDRCAQAFGGNFDRWYEKEFEAHDRQVARDDETERDNAEVELVHELDDTMKMRHHVPPSQGPVQSFKTPVSEKADGSDG